MIVPSDENSQYFEKEDRQLQQLLQQYGLMTENFTNYTLLHTSYIEIDNKELPAIEFWIESVEQGG